MPAPLLVWLTLLAHTVAERVPQPPDRPPDRGGHAVEYAVGIAGSLTIIGGIIAAVKLGLLGVISRWVFQ